MPIPVVEETFTCGFYKSCTALILTFRSLAHIDLIFMNKNICVLLATIKVFSLSWIFSSLAR